MNFLSLFSICEQEGILLGIYLNFTMHNMADIWYLINNISIKPINSNLICDYVLSVSEAKKNIFIDTDIMHIKSIRCSRCKVHLHMTFHNHSFSSTLYIM